MILAKIALNEETLLEFDMQVMGSAEQVSQTRFVLEGADYDIVCKCAATSEGISVKIPKLKGLMESGQCNARLEVILGDRIFTPLTETIEFLPLVELNVKTKSIESIKEGVTVQIKKAMFEDTKSKNPQLDKLVTEGHEVVQYGEFKILKKADRYLGLVLENKVLIASKPHVMLSHLIDELTSAK